MAIFFNSSKKNKCLPLSKNLVDVEVLMNFCMTKPGLSRSRQKAGFDNLCFPALAAEAGPYVCEVLAFFTSRISVKSMATGRHIGRVVFGRSLSRPGDQLQ